MKFAKILEAADVSPANFPKSAALDILLLDSKKRELGVEDFNKPLQFSSPFEVSKFNFAIDKLETGIENGSFVPDHLNVRLTANTLAITELQAFFSLLP